MTTRGCPVEFFSARWQGYWYVPSSQFVILHVEADDYADVWIDGELRFARSIALRRGASDWTPESTSCVSTTSSPAALSNSRCG